MHPPHYAPAHVLAEYTSKEMRRISCKCLQRKESVFKQNINEKMRPGRTRFAKIGLAMIHNNDCVQNRRPKISKTFTNLKKMHYY